MQHPFPTILIPVDFTTNTATAVQHALELANKHTSIHLLHVMRTYRIPLLQNSDKANEYSHFANITHKLSEWNNTIRSILFTDAVCNWISSGSSIDLAIEKKAIELRADLIVIGKTKYHRWLPLRNTVNPDRIARLTNIPVLAVKSSTSESSIRKVVIPVTDENYKNVLDIIRTLHHTCRIKLYLVIFGREQGSGNMQNRAFLGLYQWIKSNIQCPLDYVVLDGKNKAKAILHYAVSVDADLLITGSPTHGRKSWFSPSFVDLVAGHSNMQVLTI